MKKLSFKHWKIQTKILLSFLVVILLFLVVIVQSFTTLNDMNDNKIPLLNANEKINESMLLMRKNEKDFLLRDRQNETFFKDGKSSYIDGFKNNYSTLQSNVSFLMKSKEVEKNQKLLNELKEILTEAKIYNDTILKIVDKTKERGFKDYGLEGELRAAIHTLEDNLTDKDDIIYMLEARRSEKDYFLRHDLEYVTKVTDVINNFKNDLEGSKNKEQIKLLDEYSSKFNAVVEIEKEIGLTEADGLNGVYREAIHKLDPLINNIHQNIVKLTEDNTDFMITIMLIVSSVIILIAIFFAFIISKLITKPIKATNEMLEDIAEGDGDLTKVLNVTSKDEVGTLSLWFNKFTTKIKDIVNLVQINANTIANSSNELAKATEHANVKIENIANEMTIISDGLQNNASIIEEATASIDELANGAMVVSEESLLAEHISNDVLNAAKVGATKLGDIEKAMTHIENSSTQTYDMIKELKDSSAKINNIATLITDISGQTNLLSLNANIEAARAGEHGKGFAVVASEVKQLADESKQSADNITQLIKGIEDRIEKTYLSMQREKDLIEESTNKVIETDTEFNNILSLIEETTKKITNISEAARRQSVVAKEMANAMAEISVTTQESAASSQTINLSIQDQVSVFEEIGASIDELSNIAVKLQDQTNRFKTK